MTSQMHADLLLAKWQSMRAMPPDERIERLFIDFFAPPQLSNVEFDAVLRNVHEAMQEAA